MEKSNIAIKNVLSDQELKDLIKTCRVDFVSNSFTELAELYIKKADIRSLLESDRSDKSERFRELLLGWPRFYAGSIVHAMANVPEINEMDFMINLLECENRSSIKGNTVINLITMKQELEGQSYDLGKTMIKLSSKESKPRYVGIDEGDNYPNIILTNNDGKDTSMILAYNYEDELVATGNIEEFSILSVIRDTTPGNDDNENYIFTCFSGLLGIVYTTILQSINDVTLSMDSVVNVETREPSSKLVEGCYQCIKNADAPLTDLQKSFFVNFQPTRKVDDMFTDEVIARHIAVFEKYSKKKD